MKSQSNFWRWLRAFGRRGDVKHEIDEELRSHLARRTEQNLAAGMNSEDAAREARRRFGNWQTVREECREARGASLGEGVAQDFRFGWRTLAKSPGFTIVAILILTVGIGSAVGMFSLLQVYLLKPYSTPNGDHLVHLLANGAQPLSVPEYLDMREQAKSFAELGVYAPQSFNVGGDHPESVRGVNCTPGVLRAFGVAPALGRWLDDADEKKGAPAAVVIDYRLWQQSLGGDSNVIGRTMRVDDRAVVVVGVMPAKFEFSCPWMPGACELWHSFQLQKEQGSGWNWCTVGWLKKGVTLDAAKAEVNAIAARRGGASKDAKARMPFMVRTLRYEMTQYGISYGWMILGATGLLLVVACVNIASMLLARGVRRHGEYGVRMALGATRGRLLRLVFSESFLLSVGGTIGGAGLAAVTLHYFKHIEGVTEARGAAMRLDGNAFAFAAGLALLVGLMAGVPPALAAMRISVVDLLRSDNRSATGSSARHGLLRNLIILQIAVAFVLANLAVLFSASYAKMVTATASLATDYVLSAELDLHGGRYETNGAIARFSERLAERAAAIPGVVAAGTTTDLPLEYGPSGSYLVNAEVFDAAITRPAVVTSAITPGYFAAADIPFLQGRTLQHSDHGRDFIGIVVNRAFVDKYWRGKDPLGQIVRPNDPNPWFHGRVVGVVENVRQWGVKSEPQPQLYWATDRAWGDAVFLIVRTTQPGTVLAPGLRQAVAELDPNLPLSRIRTFKRVVREAVIQDAVVAGIVNYCMVVAIALVGIGLYGTLSYLVLQRTREIGVRVALGATRRDVVRLVFRQGFAWVLAGVGLGIVGALACATALRALVYDVNTLNPLSLLAASGAVVLAAVLACWFPARRAARVEPMEALRCE